MARMRESTEFGFATGPYLPPERHRPLWRTMLLGALLALIPIVGPGMSAVYVDRRDVPGTFDPGDAVMTAVIQVVAIALLALVLWLVLVVVLGFSIQLSPRVTGPGN